MEGGPTAQSVTEVGIELTRETAEDKLQSGESVKGLALQEEDGCLWESVWDGIQCLLKHLFFSLGEPG